MRSRTMRSGRVVLALVFAVAAAWIFTACFRQEIVASSEVGNPSKKGKVIGVVLDSSGHPISGALIRLRPREYLASDSSLAALPKEWETHSDDAGKFLLSMMDTGMYRVEMGKEKAGAFVDFRLANNSKAVELEEVRLLALGQLEGTVRVPGGSPPPRVQIPGMERLATANSETGRFVFSDLPKGLYRARFASSRSDVFPAMVENISVQTGHTTVLRADTLVENLSLWEHSLLLTFTTPAGTASEGDVPLLVRLSTKNFTFSEAKAEGEDIRFAQLDGTPLAYEIETWDPAASMATLWVKLNTLAGGEVQDGVQMYWGNRQAPGISSSLGVFTSAAEYAGVWHLSQNPKAAAPQFPDASEQGNFATLRGPTPASTNTPWGRGLILDGNQYLTTRKSHDNPRYFTHSIWIQTATTVGGWILGFSNSPTDTSKDYDRHVWMDDSGRINFGIYQGPPGIIAKPDTIFATISTTKAYNDGVWHQLTSVVAVDGQSLFVDGKLVAKDSVSRIPSPFLGYWRIGFDNIGDWKPQPSQNYFHGRIDEVRVWQKALTPARIAWEYATQNPDSK